jgi:chromosome partitioning protein
MLLQAMPGSPRSAHVIVFGNEKGGSGKSTMAIHIAVALMRAGQRVATIDLDSRQGSFTHYIANRRAWAERAKLALEIPAHFCVTRAQGIKVDESEAAEFTGFAKAISAVEHTHDFIVIDTPGTDSYLMRLAHLIGDTLVTPINDSFLDVDVLATLDPINFNVTGESHYAEMVREARRQRRIVDGGLIDWIVMRNRFSLLGLGKMKKVEAGLNELGLRLGFRLIDGLAERVVYREFYPRGLTALDTLDKTMLGMRPNLSHETARKEVMGVLAALKLPTDEGGRRRRDTAGMVGRSRQAPRRRCLARLKEHCPARHKSLRFVC